MIWLAAGLVLTAMVGAAAWYVRATNVETPDYSVERADGRIELRAYPELVVAEVTRPGSRTEAVRAGFGALARYIFARDRPGDKIAMTAPVTQMPDAADWRVGFIMPGGAALADLPPPGDDVTLRHWPERRVAAIRFSGRWTDAAFDARAEELAYWIAAEGLEAAGPPILAYYNDPFTPAFLRRNEVIVPLAAP